MGAVLEAGYHSYREPLRPTRLYTSFIKELTLVHRFRFYSVVLAWLIPGFPYAFKGWHQDSGASYVSYLLSFFLPVFIVRDALLTGGSHWMLPGEIVLENLNIVIPLPVEKVGCRNCTCLQHIVL